MRKTFIVLLALACAVVPASAQMTYCTSTTSGNVTTTICYPIQGTGGG